jgi:hypothetical protein
MMSSSNHEAPHRSGCESLHGSSPDKLGLKRLAITTGADQ